MCSRVMASSAPKGSSIISTSGSSASARAIDTRWRMPPDSCAGYRSAAYSRPTRRSSSSARSRCRSRGAASTSAISEQTFSSAVFQGISAASWNTMPTRRCRTASPGGTPARDLAAGRRHQSGEHLQQRALAAARRADDGGERAFAMSMSMSLNTRTQPARVSKSTFRPRARICAARAPPRAGPGPADAFACMSMARLNPRPRPPRKPAAARCAPSIAADAPARAWDGEFQAAAHQRRQADVGQEKASPATQGRPARCPSSSDSSADSSWRPLSCSGGSLASLKPAR